MNGWIAISWQRTRKRDGRSKVHIANVDAFPVQALCGYLAKEGLKVASSAGMPDCKTCLASKTALLNEAGKVRPSWRAR